MAARTFLILGGARSGKSARALALSEPPRCLVATSNRDPDDREMEERIRLHREERGPDWTVVEEPLDVAGAVARHGRAGATVVVDCLTLWLANLGVAGRDPAAETERLAGAVEASAGRVVLVSNELGMGLHPATELSRRFRDLHGRMNRRMAESVHTVELLVAGQPVRVKHAPPSE